MSLKSNNNIMQSSVKHTNTLIKVAFLLVIACLLQACQDKEMTDLKTFVATAYQDKKPDIEPLPEIPPYKGFAYSATEDQNPFDFSNISTSQQAVAGTSGINPDNNRRREALEQYPLDALKLVGTMTKDATPWVIVQTSEGTAHRATIGNYMGQNEGKIKAIITEEQRVILAELVLDPKGRWVTREQDLTIDE